MKRFIALLCSLALVVSMLFVLTCCVKDDGQKLPDDPDNGEQTPGVDENEGGDNKDDGIIDGGNIDLGGGEDNNDPENPDDPDNPGNSITSDWKNDPESLTYEEFLAMTPEERRRPEVVLNASRKKRIAAGSGTTVEEVNKLLKQFEQIKKMMKQFADMGAGGGRGGKKRRGKMKFPF